MFTTRISFIFLFFLYGLSFFTMGISALLQKGVKYSNFPLLQSIKYLGLFGLIHGFTEWVIMLRLTRVFIEQDPMIYLVQIMMNTISFVFLMVFGLELYNRKNRWRSFGIPLFLFLIWLAGLMVFSLFFHLPERGYAVFSALSRYFIGLPATIITGTALLHQAKDLGRLKLKAIALRYRLMAVSFFLYGIFAGIFVADKGFFPTTLLNRELIRQWIGLPAEFMRMVTAFAITILFLGSIKIFHWEGERKMRQFTEQQMRNQERRQIAREMHDGIIQNLFGTGILVENLIDEEEGVQSQDLKTVKSSLNETIEDLRNLMDRMVVKRVEFDDLQDKIEELIRIYTKKEAIDFHVEYRIPEVVLGYLSPEQATHLYYMIQEAIINIIKHANADKALIRVESTLQYLIVTIRDNGKGMEQTFDQYLKEQDHTHYGLASLEERRAAIDAEMNVKSTRRGTEIIIQVPWEGIENE